MADFDLGKQVGPLPMGAWIAVIGAGLGVGYFINKNMAKSQSEADPTPYRITESDVGRGGVGFTPVDATPAPAEPAIDPTNQMWGQQAKRWLIAQGHDPGVSDNAIRKYLYGENLTIQEQMLLNLVLVKFGPPPEPLPPVVIPVIPPPVVPPPVVKPPPVVVPPPVVKPPPPPPPPPSQTWHTVVTNDVLSRIALRYYGSGSQSSWMRIYNANAGTIENAARARGKASSRGGPYNQVGWWIFPGTRLLIP